MFKFQIQKSKSFIFVVVLLSVTVVLASCEKKENSSTNEQKHMQGSALSDKQTSGQLIQVKRLRLKKKKSEPFNPATLYESKNKMIITGVHGGIAIYNKKAGKITRFVELIDASEDWDTNGKIFINGQGSDAFGSLMNKKHTKIIIFNVNEHNKYHYVYDIKQNNAVKVQRTFRRKKLLNMNRKLHKLESKWEFLNGVSTPQTVEYYSSIDKKKYRPFV